MNKILFPFLAFLLIACMPQVTVTSEVTVTLLPPTETPIPTSTLNPQFQSLQQQIATSKNYTLTQNGDFEFQTEDGVIIVPDIKVSKSNGEITFTENGEEVELELESVDTTTNQITFIDRDGNKIILTGADILRLYTQEQLSQMTDEEKLAHAPETGPDGLVKGDVSEVKPWLVKYYIYDSENNLVLDEVFDFTEGKFKEDTEAGIIEIPLTTGENWENLSFETGQEGINHAVSDGATGTTMDMFKNPNLIPYVEQYLDNVSNLGNEYKAGNPVLNNDGDVAFGVIISNYQNGALLIYQDKDGTICTIYINQNAESLADEIINKTIIASTLTE